MNEVEPDFLNQLDAVFAQLNPQAVEEFYAAYRQWSLHQRLTELRQRIDAVREQQVDNQQRLRETQPAAIALAALARLQSNGVSDIALLDAMLERGESWLDQTMQRLDYFEQFDDFISDDYTKWCQGALEGAFDWIDSLRENQEHDAPTQLKTPPVEVSSNSEDAGEVEALLLQRLTTEDEQDDLPWQEATTLKQTAIKLPLQEIITTASEEQEPPAPEDVAQQDTETQAHITEFTAQDGPAHSDETAIETYVASSTSAEEQIIPEEALPKEVIAIPDESDPGQPSLFEFAPAEESASEDELLSEEPVAAETRLNMQEEQPALVECTAPSEVSPAEDAIDQAIQRTAPADTTTHEDIPAFEYAAQREVNEPGEIENSISEEASPHEQQAIETGQTVLPARSVHRKDGLMRRLMRFLARI